MRGRRSAADREAPQRVRRLVIVVAVIAALTAGWPLINLAVSDKRPVAAGATLRLGPNRAHSALFRVGAGWSVRSAESDPRQDYLLSRGPMRVAVSYLGLSTRAQGAHLWAGLGEILRAASSSARLGKPSPVTDARGVSGLTGLVREQTRIGRATVFPDPGGDFAIEMISLAPASASLAVRAAAQQVVTSLTFPAAAR